MLSKLQPIFWVASKKTNRLGVCKKGAHSGAPFKSSSLVSLGKERGGPFRLTTLKSGENSSPRLSFEALLIVSDAPTPL